MKKFKILLLLLLFIPCAFLFGGCEYLEDTAFITNISIESVEGDTTIYVINYSDGRTEKIPVETPSEEKCVVDIKLSSKIGKTSTYTIYYSDGSTSILTVEDGKDGKDGKDGQDGTNGTDGTDGTDGTNGTDGEDLTIDDLFNRYLVDHPGATYDDFLREYLTVSQPSNNNSIQDATNKALLSAVTIWCEFPTSTYMGSNKKTEVACGSGVIFKMTETVSYILTNYHVVYMKGCDTDDDFANKIHIFQYGTSEQAHKVVTNTNGTVTPVLDEKGYPKIGYGDGAIQATYVGGELEFDLALIKVPTNELKKYNPYVKAVEIANDYSVGETAIAIGNPECEGFSATSGIISVESEDITMLGADDSTECTFRVMRIDTAVNGGNSGGGLFNINGELIGIVNAKAVASEIDNIAYAIPYDNAKAVASNILANYNGTTPARVKKLYLGISYTIENARAIYNPTTNRSTLTNDLLVKEVTNGSVAHSMGFKSGDIIKTISINGTVHNIVQAHEFTDLLLTVRAGDKIIIEVKREGETELQKCGITDVNGILESQLKTLDEIPK